MDIESLAFVNSGASNATTYQAIIIALVAAGFLTCGIGSVILRRRRHREYLAQEERNLNLIGFTVLADGRVVPRGRDGRAGRVPMLWDAGLGIGGSDGKEFEAGWDSDGVRGSVGEGWSPLQLSLSSRPGTKLLSTPNEHVGPPDTADLTVLIAMPSPSTLSQRHPPAPLSSPTSLRRTPFLDAYRLYHQYDGGDNDDLPVMEIASTSLVLNLAGQADTTAVEEMVRTARKGDGDPEDAPSVPVERRTVRTDGFISDHGARPNLV